MTTRSVALSSKIPRLLPGAARRARSTSSVTRSSSTTSPVTSPALTLETDDLIASVQALANRVAIVAVNNAWKLDEAHEGALKTFVLVLAHWLDVVVPDLIEKGRYTQLATSAQNALDAGADVLSYVDDQDIGDLIADCYASAKRLFKRAAAVVTSPWAWGGVALAGGTIGMLWLWR